MRLRNKPWAQEKIDHHSNIVVADPEKWQGKWREVFGNDNPIHIEVGTGKGQFICGMAQRNPDINFIGIERQKSIIVSAIDRVSDTELSNVHLMNVNAVNLRDYFKKNEVHRVYLNFSDPWPKNRHDKRRLTYATFLKAYEEIVIPNGEVHLKTDNQSLFEYSLYSFSKYGMLINNVSLDLHNSDFEGNVMTEYEEKFSALGNRIYRCEAVFRNK
ncbi:tRNA (guanosine(46)-N7)-methyltransferase TrmB [Alkalihalobacillus sp. AL-G]|uniref:tRNA (guanosine(46)-N7)-methyltransferase TrmB n=1 Tax=Alkalihalobacillus sp. AL-G TaxID=2926399 RepID=UPI00272DBA26|nr:tRNA (guanosine(46)-N7)-methyltransferase TrmB [Alkalihalobacillus sp. AL-G]WLD92418.1 tRNA (guanosine(46)-N7)-methyltransferase TrmB [Alkalihalobacillus sp. AL-G]